MEERLVNYLSRPDSGCWDITLSAEEMTFKSVWGRGRIVLCPKEKEDMREFQVIGDGARKIVSLVLGRPELIVCEEEDGLEIYRLWFLDNRERKINESCDVLKAFMKECENHHISNKIKEGHLYLIIGGNEFAEVKDSNRVVNLEKKRFISEYDMSDFAEDIMRRYINGRLPFYMNSDGYLCE